MAFLKSEEVESDQISVFCQIQGREISPKSCYQTQGQKGCFGCAAPSRRCEECNENFVVVAATGTCSACTALAIEAEKSIGLSDPPKQVKCQVMKGSVSGLTCRSIQGQDECRGCEAQSRICEKCTTRAIRFPQYGYCFTCSVAELGEGWTDEVPDEPVRHLRVVARPTKTSSLDREPSKEIELLSQDFMRIPLAKIRDPSQSVRSRYDEDDLSDLGESMLNDKLIYPIIVEPIDEDTYEVLIGSRRIRAARKKRMLDIPAFVVSPQNPLDKILLMLAENIHRVQLDPFEEGRQFVRLMREHGMDTSRVAELVKRPTTYVKERVQLLSLPADVQQLVASGKLAIKNAVTVAGVADEKTQSELAHASVEHHLTRGELSRKVRKSIGAEPQDHKVISYGITPEKFSARMEEFTLWFNRALPRLILKDTNPRERQQMLKALTGLEDKVRMFAELIRSNRSPGNPKSTSSK